MAALGTVTTYAHGETKSIVALATATAANGVPSGATAGLSLADVYALFGFMPSEVGLLVYSTAGSGTMSCTLRIWAYHPGPADWFPLGVGTDANKGVINAQTSIGESDTDQIRHQETLSLPGVAGERLYFEITAIAGTGTSVEVALVARRAYP